MMSPPLRYFQLLGLVEFYQPKTIVEVGTWNGQHGMDMCRSSLNTHSEDVHYTGYDLYQDGTDTLDDIEFNAKSRVTLEDVSESFDELQAEFPSRFTYELIKGDTNKTLTETNADFVFLDGGHSPKTVWNDYEKTTNSKVIVFDDYFKEDREGKIPAIDHQGTNVIVDSLKEKAKWILPSLDRVLGGGTTSLAVIVNEGKSPPNKDILPIPIFIEVKNT
jgi:predicted O-methyltransferase YrrM